VANIQKGTASRAKGKSTKARKTAGRSQIKRHARSRSDAVPREGLPPKGTIEHILADMRNPPPRSKMVQVKIGKLNTNMNEAFRAAKTLEQSAKTTLPEAAELAKTRESFHRELGGKLKRISG
jgi:hypothetical protein